MTKPSAAKTDTTQRWSGRRTLAALHRHYLAHRRDAVRKRDIAQRIIAITLLGIGAAIGLIGHQFGNTPATVAGIVLGVGGFFAMLFYASRLYKRELRRFVNEHIDEDNTYLFCPKCDHDASAGPRPRKTCAECGQRLFRFERDEPLNPDEPWSR